MLKSLSRDNSKPLKKKESNPIPDPWALEIPAAKGAFPETWQLPTETYPLINPAGNPAARSLAGHIASPEEVLLQDWLKLKAGQAQELTAQLGEALSLLYWAEMRSETA